jgi:hypothetical protein
MGDLLEEIEDFVKDLAGNRCRTAGDGRRRESRRGQRGSAGLGTVAAMFSTGRDGLCMDGREKI